MVVASSARIPAVKTFFNPGPSTSAEIPAVGASVEPGPPTSARIVAEESVPSNTNKSRKKSRQGFKDRLRHMKKVDGTPNSTPQLEAEEKAKTLQEKQAKLMVMTLFYFCFQSKSFVKCCNLQIK